MRSVSVSITVGLFAVLFGTSFGMGCTAGYTLADTQNDIRTYHEHGLDDLDELAERLARGYRKDGEDAVLYHLEKGMLYHHHGQWDASAQHFQQAERTIEANFTRSISKNVQALLVNDLQLDYVGEAYEDFYLNTLNIINYLQKDDLEGAAVEARRVTHKLETFSDRHQGLTASLVNPPDNEEVISADTTQMILEQADAELGEVNLHPDRITPREMTQHTALGRFLSTVVHAKQGDADGARIEYQNLRSALEDQSQTSFLNQLTARSAPTLGLSSSDALKDPSQYNTLITAFSGRMPAKEERSFRIPLDLGADPVSLYLAVPVLSEFASRVSEVQVTVAGETRTMPMIEDMQAVARDMFDATKHVIYIRAVLRAFLQTAATEGLAALAREEVGEDLGWLTQQLGRAMSSYSAQADVRGWQSMPGRAHAMVAQLPVGTHEVVFEFLDRSGNVLERRTDTLTVQSGSRALSATTASFLN